MVDTDKKTNVSKPSDILQAALELLGPNGENWTQGTSAKNASGEPVYIWDTTATCFCSLGALEVVAPDGDCRRASVNYLKHFVMLRRSGLWYVSTFNDTVDSFQPVKEMFESAIARAKSEGN